MSQIKIDDIASDKACAFENCSKQTFGSITRAKKNPNKYHAKNMHHWIVRSCKLSRDIDFVLQLKKKYTF